jgi:hypothetical protein
MVSTFRHFSVPFITPLPAYINRHSTADMFVTPGILGEFILPAQQNLGTHQLLGVNFSDCLDVAEMSTDLDQEWRMNDSESSQDPQITFDHNT